MPAKYRFGYDPNDALKVTGLSATEGKALAERIFDMGLATTSVDSGDNHTTRYKVYGTLTTGDANGNATFTEATTRTPGARSR